MKDTFFDLLIVSVITMATVATIMHIISLWGEPSEIIGTTIYNIIN